MGTTYDDALFNFDINLLSPTTTNTVQDLTAKNERLRKGIKIIKRKILFSHAAVLRYKNARNYANILENNQVFSKEGCKQHLIDIRNFTEKVNRLENECHAAESREKEKNETICYLQNQIDALKLQINQLNALLLLEKNKLLLTVNTEKPKAGIKDRARKTLEKENESLRKEIDKIANLEKEIEALQKRNLTIPNLEKENETLRKENIKMLNLEKKIEELLNKNSEISPSEILDKIRHTDNVTSPNAENINETLRKENTRILHLEKENESLRKGTARIPNLETENESLRKENARIRNLEKENETIRKENAKIPNLEKSNEALRRENTNIKNLEKENERLRKENTKIKNLEKEIENLRKEKAKTSNMAREIEKLLKHLDLVKKQKDKLQQEHDQLLQKYESLPGRNSDWCDNSDVENDIFEDALPEITNNSGLGKMSQIAAKNIVPLESDNDYSNETDTGRGSSLASSDNEKCLHSPEYYLNDSPLNGNHIPELRTKVKVIDKASSPILFEKSVGIANSSINVQSERISIKEKNSMLLNTVESSVSPINVTKKVALSPIIIDENIITDLHKHEKECLELNNSLQSDNQNDSEIESILSSMQINYGAVSPIPRTPTRLRFTESVVGVSGCSGFSKILQQLEVIEKFERKLAELRKSSNETIKDFLCKSDPSLTLVSDEKSLPRQFDSDPFNDNIIMNSDQNQIAQTETFERVQHLIEDSEVNTNSNMEISDPVLTQNDNLDSTLDHLPNEKRPASFQNKGSEPSHSHTSQPSPILDENLEQAVILISPVSEELATDNDISKDTVNICAHNNVEINQLLTKESHDKKVKSKKYTKLEKLKKNLEPKYKIKRETAPLVKSLVKPKQLALIEKKATVNKSSESLNDKNVYAKAVKIMAEINSKQEKIAKSSPKPIKNPLSPKLRTKSEKDVDSNDDQMTQNCAITSRSSRKYLDIMDNCSVVLTKHPVAPPVCESYNAGSRKETNPEHQPSNEQTSRKRRSSNEPEIPCKRILRSSTVHLRLSTDDNTELSKSNTATNTNRKSIENPYNEQGKKSYTQPVLNKSESVNNLQCLQSDQHESNIISYDDLDVFSEGVEPEKQTSCPMSETETNPSSTTSCHPKESILCSMIQKYGVETVRPYAKKVPDTTVKFICDKLEQDIAKIIEVPSTETKNAMNSLVGDLRKLNYKHFVTGMIKYLTKPERKIELFGKILSPPAPAMTKAEQILLYVISHLKTHWPSVDIVDAILSNIEYTLFKLNRTPEFDVIESTSHFYAVLCRYFGARSRLRLFILDAMYCIQFKSVPLIKQCLDVWMHIIPLAHMGIAKSPLVTCLVYLLHFYKCDDKFNRVQDIRNILSRKYFYQITDWNEKKILEMFRNSIKDLKDIPVERKMLRLALIILAKRQGPRWCQNNIIKNLLQPMIEKETTPQNVKEFCVSMIGPLMKPYPVDMKVHCEIAINQLADILKNDPTPAMEEAVITSMMFINRHNQYRINQTLLAHKMKPMSSELEKILREYVRAKPLKVWKKNLSKMARF